MFTALFPPRDLSHGRGQSKNETIMTLASAVTARRLAVTLYFAMAAFSSLSWSPVLYAIVAYWLGDILDGLVARLTHRETVIGAIFDIAADRLSAIIIYMLLIQLLPSLALPIMIYLVGFAIIDTILSMSFLKFHILSINYFYLVDEDIYRWNWSVVAKALTSSAFLLITIMVQQPVISLVVAIAICGVKMYSLRRLQHVLADHDAV